MKNLIVLVLFLSIRAAWAQDATPAPAVPASPDAAPATAPVEDALIASPPAELLDSAYLSEIVRHLYRWYMDEADVENAAGVKEFPFWVRTLDVQLDPGDNSQLAELVLPLVGLSAKVKKSDYTIEDLGTEAKSDTFRIVNVARIPVPEERPADYAEVILDYKEMKDYLFRTRAQAQFPDQAMIDHLRPVLREHLGLNPNERSPGEQIVHMAPLSPVANELWILLENKKMLVRFASDIDLENPAMWDNQALGIKTYDIENQTVVSLDEVPGSNAFMTRDQVGRALFNCVILGQRLSIVNPPAGATPAGPAAE